MNPSEAKTEAFITLSQALDGALARATDPEMIALLNVASEALDDLEQADVDELLEEMGLE